MLSGVRFWPPVVPLDSAVQWALLRAFGPAAKPPPERLPSRTLDVANRLGLVSRIVGRCSPGQLQSETGAQLGILRQGAHLRAARGLSLERCTHIIDSAAQSIGLPFLLVKGAALLRLGVTSIGLRDACDVDILASNSDAPRLHSALKGRGFRERTPTHPYYHLPVLVDDAGGAIEIHTCLPHLRSAPGKQHATFDELWQGSRMLQAEGLSSCALVPTSDVLAAHAIAHGVVQHGFAPEGYPLLRMLADVIDLNVASDGSLAEMAFEWLRSDVSPQEFTALCDIANALQLGDIERLWNDSGHVGRMLRHLVCGTLDEDYRQGLKAFQAWHFLRSAGFAEFIGEYGRAAFAPSRSDMAQIYGESSQQHMLRFQILRPLDVAGRLLRTIPNASIIAARQISNRWSR